MPTISIRFVAGHYHATPWGHHTNEGAIEWPPSPWRLLRALISTGYAKVPEWGEGVIPPDALKLLLKLAGVFPAYRLPDAVGTHSRHYLPILKSAKKEGTALAIDSSAVISRDEALLVHWDVSLEAAELELLNELVSNLGCLGRAESWTECRLLNQDEIPDAGWAQPCEQSSYRGPGRDQVPLMAPVNADEYLAWRTEKVNAAVAALELPEGKKLTKKQQLELAKAIAPFPEDLISCLQVETGWLQTHRWSQPPGSRKVLYWVPSDAITVAKPIVQQRPDVEPVEFMLLALASSSRSRSVLPLVTRTLPQADLLHKVLVSRASRFDPSKAFELVGCDEAGKPLQGHKHAHLLPLSLLKEDGHLDHILVWAPGKLGAEAQRIVRSIRNTYMKGGVGELSVRFVGGGDRTIADRDVTELKPIIGQYEVWESVTPFVCPRYVKKRGKNTVEGQIRAELESRNLPCDEKEVKIEVLLQESRELRHFVRRRKNSAPPQDMGYAVRLTFEEQVTGPITLGFGSHFGLGLFRGC